MREMLFRAKGKVDGKWVYGWYCRYPFGKWPLKGAIIPSEEAESGHHRFVEVDGSTVGQYTGLKDRNGKEIFEGDILLPPGEDAANLRLVVAFERGCWTLKVPDWGWLFDTPLYEFGGEAYLKLGNIHDNPELLKEEA